MNHSVHRPASSAIRAINRAVGDLRRGVAVIIDGGGSPHMLALPAETAQEATLAEFLDFAACPPVLALTGHRLAWLGQQCDAQCGALSLPPGHRLLHLARTLAGMHGATGEIHGLAETVPAPACADAALILGKRAGLLPAMLMAECRAGLQAPDFITVPAAEILTLHGTAGADLAPAALSTIPLDYGATARVIAYRPPDGGIEHLAILIGDPARSIAPLTRVHSECFTGDRLGSLRCDCGPQLETALTRMVDEGAGVLLYMAQEGRGIGLVNKLRAYQLQDTGLDTLDANHSLGFDGDERGFADAASMLHHLGITRIRLLTNNPEKAAGLAAHGIEVIERVDHTIRANGVNDHYLATKIRRFGHHPG